MEGGWARARGGGYRARVQGRGPTPGRRPPPPGAHPQADAPLAARVGPSATSDTTPSLPPTRPTQSPATSARAWAPGRPLDSADAHLDEDGACAVGGGGQRGQHAVVGHEDGGHACQDLGPGKVGPHEVGELLLPQPLVQEELGGGAHRGTQQVQQGGQVVRALWGKRSWGSGMRGRGFGGERGRGVEREGGRGLRGRGAQRLKGEGGRWRGRRVTRQRGGRALWDGYTRWAAGRQGGAFARVPARATRAKPPPNRLGPEPQRAGPMGPLPTTIPAHACTHTPGSRTWCRL